MSNVASTKIDRSPGANSPRQGHRNPQIALAIENRRVLSLVYRGQPMDFEPYLYGRMLSGKDFLFGWQRTGSFASWRLLWVLSARDIRLTQQTFDAPRPRYHTSGLARVVALYAQLLGVPVPRLVRPTAATGTCRPQMRLSHSVKPGEVSALP